MYTLSVINVSPSEHWITLPIKKKKLFFYCYFICQTLKGLIFMKIVQTYLWSWQCKHMKDSMKFPNAKYNCPSFDFEMWPRHVLDRCGEINSSTPVTRVTAHSWFPTMIHFLLWNHFSLWIIIILLTMHLSFWINVLWPLWFEIKACWCCTSMLLL